MESLQKYVIDHHQKQLQNNNEERILPSNYTAKQV